MDKKRWLKIEGILDEALAVENPENREAYVRDVCQDDEELRREIINLLESIREANETNFLEDQ